MPNNYFRFKKFVVQQEGVPMKVSSDAVLFGAWVGKINSGNILDVGTGTGLLALMQAQKNKDAYIHAVEIDQKAYMKAMENIQLCPWKDRFHIFHESWQRYWPGCKLKYDLIISNPPFFSKSALPVDIGKKVSRHQVGLTFDELLEGASNLLKPEGKVYVIVPFDDFANIQKTGLKYGLFVHESLYVKNTVEKKAVRAFISFHKTETEIVKKGLIIKNGSGNYTDDYIGLTREFYEFFI